jgi:thiamine-monophosphate kinase
LAASTNAEYDSFLPLTERQLISRIRKLAGKSLRKTSRAGLIAGIGDDCAVLRIPAGHDTLITTDFSLEGVHFRREWDSPQNLGHRCLTRGLSDIAAMGGEPVAVFLSLALSARTPQRWADGFLKGLMKLADEFGVSFAGGDTSQSPDKILADIIVLGSVPKGKAILRSGALPGDLLYVTGELGGAAAELDELYSTRTRKISRPSSLLPQPRINVGRILRGRGLATAMIDISDGLSTDLSHICDESGVGAQVWEDAIPRATFSKRRVDLRFALHGGDAYELLFTASKRTLVPASIGGVKITAVGEITHHKSIFLLQRNGSRTVLEPQGWEHFQRRPRW